MLPQTVREILGVITFLAIIWDTVITFILLAKMLKKKEKYRPRGHNRMSVTDITNLVQALCALCTAALTTYTLYKLIKEGKSNDKSTDSGIRNSSNSDGGDDSTSSPGKTTS